MLPVSFFFFKKKVFGVLHLIYVKLADLSDIHPKWFLLRIKKKAIHQGEIHIMYNSPFSSTQSSGTGDIHSVGPPPPLSRFKIFPSLQSKAPYPLRSLSPVLPSSAPGKHQSALSVLETSHKRNHAIGDFLCWACFTQDHVSEIQPCFTYGCFVPSHV